MKFSKQTIRIILAFMFVVVALSVVLTGLFIDCRHIKRYGGDVNSASIEFGIDKALILAVIKVESDFDEQALSKKGAVGLMQLMPQTAHYVALLNGIEYDSLFNPALNVRLGAAYLKYLFARFCDLTLVLAAYNAGEGRVCEWLKNKEYSKDGKTLARIPFEQTRNYVKRVKTRYNLYSLIYV